MCGIAGLVGPNLGSPTTIEKMTERLRHRGPDASGLWSAEQVHFGHRRLSIIDLSEAGNQPMRRDGLTVVYNGEIYNFRELGRRLDRRLTTESDTEVVLESFRQHGPCCLQDFRGMFAFALWNEEEQSLFLARDQFGVKPLHYRVLEGRGLAFSSELAPLLELGRPELDPSAIRDYLFCGYVPSPKTVWKGIFKLPPGHHLTWRRGELEVERYWHVEVDGFETDPRAIVERTRELLGTAVREGQVSDVPLGVFLSGGVDSAAVASFCEGSIQAFTLGQRQKHRDESGRAGRLAAHLGLPHHVFPAESVSLDEALDHVVEAFGEPFGDSGALSTWLLSKAASQKVKVVLGGDGGDELFAGYRWYGRAASIPRSPGRALLAKASPILTKLYRSSARRSLEGLDRFAAFAGIFLPQQVRALGGPELGDVLQDDMLWHLRAYWREEMPLRQRMQYVDIHTLLPDRMLTKVDRASMAWSLEVRPVLLDVRLAQCALSAHPDTRRHPETDEGKVNLRRAIEDRLPPGYLDSPKKGFNLAISRWIRESPDIRRDALHRLAESGFIRPHRILDLTNEQNWSLLILDRWLSKNLPSYSGN